MKRRMLFVGASVIVLSVFLLGDWNPGKYVAKPNEEIYGTWTNEQNYGGPYSPQKEVITADGVKKYSHISDSVPLEEYTKVIDSKWTDAEGNVWYKTFGRATAGPWKGFHWQGLDKLSKSGTVWESVFYAWGSEMEFDSRNYPTKIDPQDMTYRIEYRAKE